MYYLDIFCSLCIPLNLVLTLIFSNPYIVLGKMCLPSLIVIDPNPNHPNPPNSTGAVYNHHQDPQTGSPDTIYHQAAGNVRQMCA